MNSIKSESLFTWYNNNFLKYKFVLCLLRQDGRKSIGL